MHPADLRLMRVSDDRSRQVDLSFRERGWISERGKIWNWVVGWIKAMSRDSAKISDHRLGARISLPFGDPQRRISAACIKNVDAFPFLRAPNDPVIFAVCQIVQLFGN